MESKTKGCPLIKCNEEENGWNRLGIGWVKGEKLIHQILISAGLAVTIAASLLQPRPVQCEPEVIQEPSEGIIEAEETWIPEEYIGHIEEISAYYDVCPELIMVIVEHESSGRADVSNGSCQGLMQVSTKWHKGRMEKLGVTDLFDPYSNIMVGTDYLVELLERYKDTPMALMTYNGSSDAYSRWENGNYTYYAKSIMERAEELERLHGK